MFIVGIRIFRSLKKNGNCVQVDEVTWTDNYSRIRSSTLPLSRTFREAAYGTPDALKSSNKSLR